jgi:hypothetical protein
MIVELFFLLLLVSFCFHVFFLVQYALRGDKRDLKRFTQTAITNIVIAGSLIFVALLWPGLVRGVKLKVIVWLFSGLIMIMMLMIKVTVFKIIYRRSKDPAHFHYNFFGKKVLHPTVVRPVEVILFMFTIPFFLIAGAYFIARLINLIIFKQL